MILRYEFVFLHSIDFKILIHIFIFEYYRMIKQSSYDAQQTISKEEQDEQSRNQRQESHQVLNISRSIEMKLRRTITNLENQLREKISEIKFWKKKYRQCLEKLII